MKTNADILEQANARIDKGDIEGFLAFCTEDTVWTFVGDRVLDGKAAVRAWMKETYLHPPVNDVTRMIADAEHVVAYGEVTVTDAAGKATRSAYCDVWRCRDGKLHELRAFVIPGGLRRLRFARGVASALAIFARRDARPLPKGVAERRFRRVAGKLGGLREGRTGAQEERRALHP